MKNFIKFHCDSADNFKNNQLVKAFSYKDYEVDSHNHDFYEMNIVLKGDGFQTINNNSFKVRQGDVFVIPPMMSHSYHNTNCLEVYHILLHEDFIRENQEEAMNVPGYLQLMEIEPFLRYKLPESVFLHLTQSQLMQLQYDLAFLDEESGLENELFCPLRHHLMWKIIYWFSYLLSEQINSGEVKKVNNYQYAIIQVLEYIHQNYGEKLTIKLLAEKAFLSRSTFLRSFYNICGTTPVKYINEYRRKKALEMMENTKLSKTEIANVCGFYDLSHMQRMIRDEKHPRGK